MIYNACYKVNARSHVLDTYSDAVLDVVWIHPQKFLDMVPKVELDIIRVENIAESIKHNGLLEYPFVDIDIDTKLVVAHEGRHRALALLMLGQKAMPVAVFLRKDGRLVRNVRNIEQKTIKSILSLLVL